MEKGSKPVKAYKGFNKHMQCTPNGKIFQYEIGKEYKEDEADLCHCGFHACENPLDVLSYYNNIDDKFCEVELDEIDPNRNRDSKICGKKIKIGIEIGFLGLFKAGIEWIKNKTIFTKEDFEKLPSGYDAQIGSSGDGAQIGSSGDDAKIGSSGYGAKIGSSGDDCVIMCAGINSSAKAKIGSWITLAEWKYSEEKQRYIPFSVVTKQVDGIEIKEDVYYTLQDGKFKESEQQ
ncbi:DUF7666 domain-containing protein [Odoribacter splanchnicus]|uniref:DUF7666 domain-containing protein n=1 Tax=Odoribacter splanchnicus TaxID=28118 RepID=UPI000B398414|nr:hypothetical protein [Odoribacter splanchnicus]OUO16574.1 hypothetical protein B5F93_00450 [Odoribacter splanchnicus]